jgi:hypothetical protein
VRPNPRGSARTCGDSIVSVHCVLAMREPVARVTPQQ